MKAVICPKYGPPEVLRIKNEPIPEVGENDVKIKVHAASVNTSDVRIRAQDTGTGLSAAIIKPIMRLVIGFKGPRRRIQGSVVSGVVEEVGESVSRLKIGDEVYGLTGLSFGGLAEYCVLPQKRAIALKPKTASFIEAAAIPFGGTAALYFLRKAGIKTAKQVLIYGSTGAVGTAAVQIAAHYGTEVTAVCGADGEELSKELGASQTYDYQKQSLSGLEGKYDIIFDAVGKISKKEAAHLLAPTGKYTTVDGMDVAKEYTADLEQLAQMFDEGELKAVIDRVYELDEIVEVHEYIETGQKMGNVVVAIRA